MTDIKELPILFQTEMVQAVLADRKTQTRRTRGLDRINDPGYFEDVSRMSLGVNVGDNYGLLIYENGDVHNYTFIKSPYGKPGDLLWVRETFAAIDYGPGRTRIAFKADDSIIHGHFKWKPSIHMPKADARIWLMVEDVLVERLQDISEEDAKAEGVKFCLNKYNGGTAYFDYSGRIGAQGFNYDTAKESFQTLWQSINGPESWNSNPWVWVVKFRVLSKTGRPGNEVIREAYREVTG